MAERTRREALRALAVTAGALALVPAVTASRCRRTEDLAAGPDTTGGDGDEGAEGAGGGASADDPTAPRSSTGRPGGPAGTAGQRRRFTQTYRGRRIEGTWAAPSRAARDGAGHGPSDSSGGAGGDGAGRWHITVDGRPLHLMRRADGTWISMVDHYASYPTPLAAARGAVDVLGPGNHLRDSDTAHVM